MLRRAGEHFRILTNGHYVRLVTDQDAAGRNLLLAVTNDGTECPMEALSDGTLALHIAAIEPQAGRGRLLPFIADDLLTSFDDERATSAVRLLIHLGQTTQVILFTHHEHIARLADAEDNTTILRLPAPFTTIVQRAAE